MSIDVRRASERYETVQAGIRSWHCFSAGAHYDPANTSFGPLIACDEHELAPGAGFAEHAHRGVVILSWVLAGTLRHRGDDGRTQLVEPGRVQVQIAGSGIRHCEDNPSAPQPLRFVQSVLLADADEPGYRVEGGDGPIEVAGATFEVLRVGAARLAGPLHVFVARGAFTVDGTRLAQGDSARSDAAVDAAVDVAADVAGDLGGADELLIWRFPTPR